MAKIEAEMVGAKELARAVRKESSEFGDELKQANKESAELVKMAVDVPRQSGTLAGSLRSSATLRWSYVRVGSAKVPYAPPIHWGWIRRRIKPQPFLYEALDARAGQVVDRYEAARDRLVAAINTST